MSYLNSIIMTSINIVAGIVVYVRIEYKMLHAEWPGLSIKYLLQGWVW